MKVRRFLKTEEFIVLQGEETIIIGYFCSLKNGTEYFMKYDLCCIGYITLDKVVTPQKTVHMPGGTSFYFAHAIKHLSTEGFQLVTALADSEMPVVDDLRKQNIEVKVLPSARSICFENIYGEDTNERKQR